MIAHETQPLLSALHSTLKSSTNCNVPQRRVCGDIRFCLRRVCLQHKAVILILVWTMIVGELLAIQQLLTGEFIENYVPISSHGKKQFVNSVSSPLAFVHVTLAVVAICFIHLVVF